MAQNGQEDIGVWSEDHRRSGSRVLTEEECAEVSRLGAHGRLRGALMLLPIPFLFLTCVRALPLLADLKEAWILLTVFVLGVLLGLTPLLLLKARDRLREGRELGRDARSGFVELFGRVTVEESETFGGAARPEGQSVLGKARCFEVLPNSGLVWRVDGIRVSGWQHARRAAAADPPPYAAIAAEWVEPIAGVGDGAVHLGHRELSTAEQKE